MSYNVQIDQVSYPVTISGGGTASVVASLVTGGVAVPAPFATRAAFVAWAPGKVPALGTVVFVAGFMYRYVESGTAIPDLPGWVPFDQVYPDHWQENLIPGTTSMYLAINLADAFAALGNGVVRFRAVAYLWDGPTTRSEKTAWYGEVTSAASGGVGSTLKFAYDGVCCTITGTNTNYQAGTFGLRLIGDRVAYPQCVGFDFINCNDHHFDKVVAGNMRYLIRGKNCKTFDFTKFYGFGALADGVYLFGDSPTQNTDHCITDSQFAGDLSGLRVVNAGSIELLGCRPQVSGVANAIFDTCTFVGIHGGECDSAIIFNGDTGTGDGLQFRNCDVVRIHGVDFHSNGAGSADIRVIADNAISGDFSIVGTMHSLGTSGTRTGIAFEKSGTGEIRRVSILGCGFAGMTVPISGQPAVSHELRVNACIGIPGYEGLDAVASNRQFPYHAAVLRLTGTLGTSFDVTVPNCRSWEGDEITLSRAHAGAGVVTFKGPNGAVIGTLSAPGTIRAFCNQSDPNPANTTYVAVA